MAALATDLRAISVVYPSLRAKNAEIQVKGTVGLPLFAVVKSNYKKEAALLPLTCLH